MQVPVAYNLTRAGLSHIQVTCTQVTCLCSLVTGHAWGLPPVSWVPHRSVLLARTLLLRLTCRKLRCAILLVVPRGLNGGNPATGWTLPPVFCALDDVLVVTT